MPSSYSPPHTITPAILSLVAEIAGEIGRLGALNGTAHVPKLRRENRIRSIHASLAIENNTLSLDQVTAIISGKRVLGLPREIQEVKNTFAAYETMPSWNGMTRFVIRTRMPQQHRRGDGTHRRYPASSSSSESQRLMTTDNKRCP